MADGTSKRIADIRAGDVVLAKNEQTGKVEAQTVSATVNHPAETLVSVTLTGKNGASEVITCTPEHPLFVDGKGWMPAGGLGVGNVIVTRAGPNVAVAKVEWQRSGEGKDGQDSESNQSKPAFTVYNFTVDADHSYFVGTAGGGAWTHNTCTIIGRRIRPSCSVEKL